MASVLTVERTGTSYPGTTAPGFGPHAAPTGAPMGTNWCVLPSCKITVEKCSGGCKVHCSCEDEVACGALQNLCKMLAAGTCSLCCTWNGICVCQCNFTCGSCKCEFTKDGVTITCTSGDKKCCEMIQACCECCSSCLDAGCCCYVCYNNTPVCCGTC